MKQSMNKHLKKQKLELKRKAKTNRSLRNRTKHKTWNGAKKRALRELHRKSREQKRERD